SYLIRRKPSRSNRLTMTDADSDRISCLPDLIINQILSHLSIKEAVRTSVLSSMWRNKWSTQLDLVFDRQCVSGATSQDPSVIESKFLRIVDHVLLLHSGPINKFEVSDSGCDLIGVNSMADIDRWIRHLIGRSIKELVLDIWFEQRYKIPWCLFSCQSLCRLNLYCCWLKPPTTFEGFRNLKSLELERVTVAQDAFEHLISSSPLLEKLILTDFHGFTHINIHAPNLKYIQITGDVPVELPRPCIDLRSLCLFINFNDLKQISVALCLLKSSPKLRKFGMFVPLEEQTSLLTPASYCWEELFSEPDTPLLVRHLAIEDISGTKSELDFIRFLLLYSPVLEKLIVKPIVNVKPELMIELIRFRRASAQAEVIYRVNDSS
ncbi:F-box/FBD/LRR-repeat protein, partial [Trifolium pratense]